MTKQTLRVESCLQLTTNPAYLTNLKSEGHRKVYFKVAGLWFTKEPVSFAPYLASSSPDPHKAWQHFGCRDWHETPVDATCVSLLCNREFLIHKVLLLVLGPTEQHTLPRSKPYGSNNGLMILPHCCDPKESRCHETTSTEGRQGSPFFHFTIYTNASVKKYTIKMCRMMSSSCYFTPQSSPFLLISSLVKSQNMHFSCYGFGVHINILKTEQQIFKG